MPEDVLQRLRIEPLLNDDSDAMENLRPAAREETDCVLSIGVSRILSSFAKSEDDFGLKVSLIFVNVSRFGDDFPCEGNGELTALLVALDFTTEGAEKVSGPAGASSKRWLQSSILPFEPVCT